MELTELLEAWFTGRDARGFDILGRRWRNGVEVREYTPHLSDLRGMLRPKKLGFEKIAVRLAFGADDQTDLRLDLYVSLGKPPEPMRWRPVNGSLNGVIDRGKTHRDHFAIDARLLADAARASVLTRDESLAAASAIRMRKLMLSEKKEAMEALGLDTQSVSVEIDDCISKRAQLADREIATREAVR